MKRNRTKLGHAPPRGAADEVAWAVAEGTQIAPGLFKDDERIGVIVARPHRTGWFVSAHHRMGLDDAHMVKLREYVTVHVFGLLWRGPLEAAWTHHPATDFWSADISTDSVRDLQPLPDYSLANRDGFAQP
ncbi:MAG: hypothetical protein ABI775_08790 [Pseudonocardiales bacterium]|nr:hypothetical protein [Actinomycetota bacterium]